MRFLRAPTPLSLLLAAVLGTAAVFSSAPVRADEPEQWVVGPSAGGAGVRVEQRWRYGLQIGVEGRYGLTEFWALRGAAHISWHGGEGGSQAFPPVQTGTAVLGLAYAWDVLRVVPFAEAGVVLAGIRADLPQSGLFAGVQLGAGVNYLIDRQWAAGACLRFQHLGLGVSLDASPADAPMLLGILLRAERRF
jgi:hypothetical protein